MKKIFTFVATCLLSFSVCSAVIQVKGTGTVTYSELTPAVKDRAYQSAQVSAVERYFAERGEAESENFETIQDKVQENLEKFILSTIVINEQDQPSLRKYSVVVRIDLNEAKLRNTLRSSSTVNRASGGQKSPLVFIFVGRETSSVRSFDEKVFKRVDVAEKGGKSDVSLQVETGGSTTRKSAEISYKLLPMSNHTGSITSVFSQGGFSVVDSADALGDKEYQAATKEFSKGSDLSNVTKRAINGQLKAKNIPYLVLATLDVGAPSQDDATGMRRVGVTVTARVLDLTGPLPTEAASVPAVQYYGIAPDDQSAITKALKDGATAAAREVVSRLNAKGVL